MMRKNSSFSRIMEASSINKSDDFKQREMEHRLDFLYGNALPSTFGSFAVVLVLASALSLEVDLQLLFIWFLSSIILTAIRLMLWMAYRKRKKGQSVQFWLSCYRTMSFASGVLNGMAMWLFFDDIPPEYQLLIIFTIGGLSAAASGTHAVDMLTFLVFLFSAWTLTITKLLSYGEASYIALSIMLLIFVLVMERVGRQTNYTLKENFKLTDSMHYRATHDPLVGLLNREEFENQFEMRLPLTRHGVAMLFLDLDNFKPLNDTLGHQVGDGALKEVADILLQSVRGDDIVARLGGDEFVILLFLDDTREIERIAYKILSEITSIHFPGAHEYAGLTASIGISFNPDNRVLFSQLMRTADTACYQSKEQGKNQITLLYV